MFGTVLHCVRTTWMPFLMMAGVLLPMLWPVWRARHPLRLGQTRPYLIQLWAALVVGGLSSWMLWPFLFGDELKHGSTAGFIFLIAPIYSAMALFAAYGLGMWVDRSVISRRALSGPALRTPAWAQHLLWLPVALLCITLVGIGLVSAKLCAV